MLAIGDESMCGKYTRVASQGEIEGAFDIKADCFDWLSRLPRHNIAPSQRLLGVVNTQEDNPGADHTPPSPSGGGRIADLFRWGLVPFWAKNPAIGNRMINARAETVAQKPAFRTCVRQKRCRVIADGFYEWKAIDRQENSNTDHPAIWRAIRLCRFMG